MELFNSDDAFFQGSHHQLVINSFDLFSSSTEFSRSRFQARRSPSLSHLSSSRCHKITGFLTTIDFSIHAFFACVSFLVLLSGGISSFSRSGRRFRFSIGIVHHPSFHSCYICWIILILRRNFRSGCFFGYWVSSNLFSDRIKCSPFRQFRTN